MIAPRLRIRLPSAPKDGTPSQRQWFAAVTNWINAVVDDTQTPVAETQDKVTRRSLQIDMVDNTPDLEKPLSQAAQARFTAIQESLSRLTASTSVTVISDWDVAATGATPTTAKSGMYFRATTAGTVGAVPLNIGDVVLFYLDNTGALQWIIVDSPAERSAAYTPADWAATTGVARIENKPTLFGLSSLLEGLAAGTNVAIAATDSLIIALAKLQAQLTTNATNIAANSALITPVRKKIGGARYVTGRLYDCVFPYAQSLTTAANGAGKQLFFPMQILENGSFDQITVNVSAAGAGSSLLLGIYDSDAQNLPNNLLIKSSALDSTTTGQKTFGITQSFTAGQVIWLSLLNLTASVTYTAIAGSALPAFRGHATITQLPVGVFYKSSQSDMSSTAGTVLESQNANFPRIMLRGA